VALARPQDRVGLHSGRDLRRARRLALAFRRIREWRDSWLPTIATVPAIIVANVAFSPIGGGAATRAGTVTVFLAIAFIGFRLIREPRRAAMPLPVGSDDRRLAEGGTP